MSREIAKKKVILINRSLVRVRGLKVSARKWQPLDLAYIAAILEQQDIECRIVDARALDLSVAEVVEEVNNYRPDLVIFATDPVDFYACPNPNWQTIEETVTGIKALSDIKILAFGPQIGLFSNELMPRLGIDFGVKGDNPLLVAEAAQDVLSQGTTERVGTCHLDQQGNLVAVGSANNLENLTCLPLPAYHLLPMDLYKCDMVAMPDDKFSIVIGSRGCPFHCKYCYKGMIGDTVRTRDLPEVMAEIKTLANDYGVKVIYFFDEIFTFDRQRVLDLCRLLSDAALGISWGCQTRTDFVDDELLKIMREAGCCYISYGIESGSQRIVDLVNKRLNLIKAGESIELTRKNGIYPHLNMIFGFPTETKKDFDQTIKFMIKYCTDDLIPNKLNYLIGTSLYNEYCPELKHQQAIDASQRMKFSAMKPTDAERGLARWMLYRHWTKRKIDKMFVYYLIKYLVPGLIVRIKIWRGQYYDKV